MVNRSAERISGEPVGVGERGELCVRGFQMMKDYYKMPEKTAETIEGAWIRTGDKFYQDADGYFWHCGRIDDMLKVGGLWVSPTEVEGAVASPPSNCTKGRGAAASA